MVNVGSASQPRDGDPRAAYSVYDTGEARVEIKRVCYDMETAQQKNRYAGLPKYFLNVSLLENKHRLPCRS